MAEGTPSGSTRRSGDEPCPAEGEARSPSAALRRGLRAEGFALLPHEDAAAFRCLVDELRRAVRPADAVECLYVDAIAIAIWRERRADRLEAEVLADIAPAEEGRSCGSDLGTAAARESLATLFRYRSAAQMEHRRALAMLAAHRRLRAARPHEAEGSARRAPATRVADCPLPTVDPAERAGSPEPATRDRAPAAPPPAQPPAPIRIELRAADRARLNPLDTPLLRAMGRDPDLVLPVPGVEPRFWPRAQERASTGPYPPDGPRPYRRIPGLPSELWWNHQHLLERAPPRPTPEPAPRTPASEPEERSARAA